MRECEMVSRSSLWAYDVLFKPFSALRWRTRLPGRGGASVEGTQDAKTRTIRFDVDTLELIVDFRQSESQRREAWGRGL